jgi:hypothetical protein
MDMDMSLINQFSFSFVGSIHPRREYGHDVQFIWSHILIKFLFSSMFNMKFPWNVKGFGSFMFP